MSYDINVLVNGSRCKQYLHKGRTYIEAKEGSEYVIEIKNNSWEKVLAVVAVDSRNVVDGEPAEPNGPGYVLDRYTAQKLYGFQYSQEKVATFKFGALGATDTEGNKLGYAASKGDGSEKNAGVIGVRIWDEVPKPTPPPAPAPVWAPNSYSYTATGSFAISCSYSLGSSNYSPNPTMWGSSVVTSAAGGVIHSTSGISQNSRAYPDMSRSDLLKEAIADAKAIRATALAAPKSANASTFNMQNMVEDHCIPVGSNAVYTAQCLTSPGITVAEEDNSMVEVDMACFDMETQWGESKTYKVKETTFERKSVIHSVDIYYASRESLIAMGVDLGTEKRVSFPESFKETKYAKPPKGWRG